MCARARRPLAQPAAHPHAQGTQVASTAGTRRRPRVAARLAQGQATTRGAPPRALSEKAHQTRADQIRPDQNRPGDAKPGRAKSKKA